MASKWEGAFGTEEQQTAPATTRWSGAFDEEEPSATTSAPLPAYARWPAGILASLGHGALAGAGALGDIESLGTRFVANPLSRAFGLQEDDPSKTFFPNSSDTLGLAPALESALHNSLAPQGPMESLAQGAASGVGSALPSLAFGAPPVSSLISGAAGGTAGEGAELLGAPPAVAAAAGFAGGVGTLALGAGARSVLSIARDLGDSKTYQQAGTALQDAAEEWRARNLTKGAEGNQIDAAEALVDQKVPPTTPVAPQEMTDRIQELLARGGSAADSVRQFLRNTQRSGGAIGQTAKDLNANLVLGGAPPSMSWDSARQFRTELGTVMRSARPAERPALEHLYGGLTSDLGDAATSVGAGQEFANFNKVSTDVHALNEGPIEKILSVAPETAAQRLLSGKGKSTDLAALRGVIPEAVDELGAAHLTLNPDGKALAKLSPESLSAIVPSEADRAVLGGSFPSQGEPPLGTKMLESLTSGEALSRVGGLIGGYTGIPGGAKAGEYIGGLAGQVLPWAYGVGKRTLLHPTLPLVGTIAGGGVPQPAMQFSWPQQSQP